MQNYYSLSDEQFGLIEHILREDLDRRGRKPTISDRHALEGALYILCKGCPWRAMPEVFGNWMMVFMRYKRWVERGVWWKMLMRLQKAQVLEVRVALVGGPGSEALRQRAIITERAIQHRTSQQ